MSSRTCSSSSSSSRKAASGSSSSSGGGGGGGNSSSRSRRSSSCSSSGVTKDGPLSSSSRSRGDGSEAAAKERIRDRRLMESVKELDEAMSVFVSSHPHETVMKAINMLLMVIKQVVENPHEAKFRRVRATEDSPFMRVMGGLEGMGDVMRAIRFKKEVNWWVLEASVHSWDIINACSYKLTSYKEMSEVPMKAAAGLEAAANDPALVARLAEKLSRMLPPGADAAPPTVNPFSLPGGPSEMELAEQIRAILPDVMDPEASRPSFEAFKNPHLMGMKPGGGTFDGLVVPGREVDVAAHIAAIAANTLPADVGMAVNGQPVRLAPRTAAAGAADTSRSS